MAFELSDTCYEVLEDGRPLVFERRWFQEGTSPERSAERVTKGRLDGKPIEDAELERLVGSLPL